MFPQYGGDKHQMEDDNCHTPQATQTTRDAFLAAVHLHDGVERVYIRLPRCQDSHHLWSICLGIRHCRDSPLAAAPPVKIDNEALQLLLPARGGLRGLWGRLTRRRARAGHHPCPQRRQDQEGHQLHLLRLVWCLACQRQPEVMCHYRAFLACCAVWYYSGPLQPRG